MQMTTKNKGEKNKKIKYRPHSGDKDTLYIKKQS